MAGRNGRDDDAVLSEPNLAQQLQRWADGKVTLKEVRGYSDEELYCIARTAYFFYHQGKLEEARTLFQGLYALNPLDAYFARALGVVELAVGNARGAMAAYDVAIKLAPDDPSGYLGRAEVCFSLGQKTSAIEDLRRASEVGDPAHPLKSKIYAMLEDFSSR